MYLARYLKESVYLKLNIVKKLFLKSWGIAEHIVGTSDVKGILGTVRLNADENGAEMQATDIRTSIITSVEGVTVMEPGEAIIPVKRVTDLFKKATGDEFTLNIDDGKAVMKAGKSRYSFTTYPVSDFPQLPASSDGTRVCSVSAAVLSETINRGSICASAHDNEFPVYLASVYFDVVDGVLNVVSTDKKRLALGKMDIERDSEPINFLLPNKGIRELTHILDTLESSAEVQIINTDAQVFFKMTSMEFAARKVESNFPRYERIIPTSFVATVSIDTQQLISALERIDIVVRDGNRVVLVQVSGGDSCTLSGRSPEFGEAVEDIECIVSGESIRIGINVRFLLEAVKASGGQNTIFNFTPRNGHVMVRSNEAPDRFMSLVAPVELSKEESADVTQEAEIIESGI
jgi:DNA polymerase-3 subunit beta